MPAPSHPSLLIETSRTSISKVLYDELKALARGPVVGPSDPEFFDRTRTFNGKLKPHATVAVSPLDAEDVSKVVLFCVKHGLSPSVRAGGYGIAGWSVAGDIIVDLSLIREVDIESPASEGADGSQWTRLRDMPTLGSKGKARAVAGKFSQPPRMHPVTSAATTNSESPSPTPSMKRRREDPPEGSPVPVDGYPSASSGGSNAAAYAEATLRSYDSASHSVASFLRGPPLPPEAGESPREPPKNRRRLDSPEPAEDVDASNKLPKLTLDKHMSPDAPSGPGTNSESRSSRSETGNSTAAALETPFVPGRNGEAAKAAPSGPSQADAQQNPAPFGYMSDPPSTSRVPMYGSGDPFGYAIPTSGASSSPFSVVGAWHPPTFGQSLMTSWGLGAGPGMLGRPDAFPASSSSLPLMPGSFSLPPTHMGTIAPARPIHTHAYVTLGAGTKQKEVDLYTADHPLGGTSGVTGMREEGVVPYHVPMSAHPVGSSVMLLAGFGFLSRMHGLTIDNLVEVEMVLADGRIVTVSEEENPDLWWAVRGAGPAFGIATRYKVKAYPVPVVFAGNLIYRFHRATAPSLIKHFRDCIKGAPRELYANVLLTAGPADKDSLVVIQMCYVGSKEKGMEYLQAISSWDGERCLLNEVNEKSFLSQQDSVAQILRGRPGRQWFIRSSLIHSLPDEVIHKTVMQFANTPIGCTWIFELAGGAIGDFEDNCLPKEQREATWTVAALHQWDMGIDDPRCVTSAEDWMEGVIKPVSLGGPYPTFLGRHEPPSRTMACYGKNWARLAELKKIYDPRCLFKNNFWPLDRAGQPIEPLHNEPPSP